jgi:RNA polymerase sigma-70 factor, ECF subfamily
MFFIKKQPYILSAFFRHEIQLWVIDVSPTLIYETTFSLASSYYRMCITRRLAFVKNEGLQDSISMDGMNRNDAIIYLMRRYGEEIKRVVYMLVQNWQQAETITQDVFITAYAELDRFRLVEDLAVRNWIYSIMIRKTKQHLDSWTFRKQVLRGKSKSPACNTDTVSEDRLLYEAILALPNKFREVIILHYYCQFSLVETGHISKLRLSKVELRVNEGKKLLQKSLETLGGDISWEII